jgi:hypothetical protein
MKRYKVYQGKGLLVMKGLHKTKGIIHEVIYPPLPPILERTPFMKLINRPGLHKRNKFSREGYERIVHKGTFTTLQEFKRNNSMI